MVDIKQINVDGTLMDINVLDGKITKAQLATAVQNILDEGYKFMGVATPNDAAVSPVGKVFYIANGKGTYTNKGGIVVTEDEVVILYYDTTWHKLTTGIASNEFSYKSSLINVDLIIPGASEYTLQTAVNALWDNKRQLCQKGAIITFYKYPKYEIYQFKHNDNIIQEQSWKNVLRWEQITEQHRIVIPASSGIAGINSNLWANPSGCLIELEEGTYTGSAALNTTNGGSIICSNCIVVGKGAKTIISRDAGYNDLIANVGDGNVFIGCNFAHSVSRKTSSAVFNQCLVGGHFVDDTMRSCYDVKVAAFNSSENAKMNADIIAGETGAQAAINTAIDSLPNGGTIYLYAGTYNLSSYINLRGKSNIALKGSGYNTFLNREGGYEIMADTADNCCISELRYNDVNLSSTTYLYNVWSYGVYLDHVPNNLAPRVVRPSRGIAGINTEINNLGVNGGKIVLEEGEYTGTTGINFTGRNVVVEGRGAKTIINRTSGGNEVFSNTASATGNILRDVKLTHTFQQSGDFPTQRYRMEDCIVNDEIINQCDVSSVIINIGKSYFYKDIHTPYAIVSAHNWKYSERFEMHIHGHIVEESSLWCDKPVDMIGHNALVEFRGNKDVFVTFDSIPSAYTNDMISSYPTTIKDIHFIKTGCFNYRDAPAVSVLSGNTIFRNCIFENASSSPSPFDNSTQEVGAEDANGCRRHGVVVSIQKWGKDCKTEFHDCIGIGSPYGFQSTRGWYLVYGSPKLFNCVGYGGGIGEFGHGIISHRASNAQLFDCVAHAGEHTYRQGAGFRYQAHGSSNLTNCIGYGSHGTQVKSDGVSEAKVLQYCSQLGITDTSFLYSSGVFKYENMNVKNVDDGFNSARIMLGKNIKNSDIELVELGNVSEEGYGISMWAHDGEPILNNCIGYAGHGVNSKGLHIVGNSKPTIIGGYFGNEKEVYKKYLTKDSLGYCVFSMPGTQISQYTPYIITSMGMTITGSLYSQRHLVVHVVTDETTPREVIEPFDTYGISSIAMFTMKNISIPAGVGLKAYMTENGAVVTNYDNDYFYLMLTFKAYQQTCSGLYIGGNANPCIKGSIISSVGEAVKSTVENIKVFDCALEGNVDSSITFADKEYVNGSSNYIVE